MASSTKLSQRTFERCAHLPRKLPLGALNLAHEHKHLFYRLSRLHVCVNPHLPWVVLDIAGQ